MTNTAGTLLLNAGQFGFVPAPNQCAARRAAGSRTARHHPGAISTNIASRGVGIGANRDDLRDAVGVAGSAGTARWEEHSANMAASSRHERRQHRCKVPPELCLKKPCTQLSIPSDAGAFKATPPSSPAARGPMR